jgi:hypothetical protein
MSNNYEVAEIIEIGKAQDVILGSSKERPLVDDSPIQVFREFEEAEDE